MVASIHGEPETVLLLARCRFRKLYPFDFATTDESEHDRRMIAIGLLVARMLRDFFKPRLQLEAEILILRANRHPSHIRPAGQGVGRARNRAPFLPLLGP